MSDILSLIILMVGAVATSAIGFVVAILIIGIFILGVSELIKRVFGDENKIHRTR